MILLELACLGIRSFRQVTKLALKPGLNLIHGRTGAGKTTLFGCLDILLFGTPADQIGLSTKDAAGPAQAAVTVKLRTGDIVRVITDFSKGAFQILKWEPATRAFAPLAAAPSALAPLWAPECHGLPLADVRAAVLWSPASTIPLGDGELPAFVPGAAPPSAILTPDERAARVARLAELQTTLVRAERLAKSADQRTDAVAREAKARNRVAALDALNARRADSASRKDEMAPLLRGSKDLDAQLDGYIKALPALAEEQAALQEDLAGLAVQIEEAGATTLLKAPLFLAGAGITGVSFVVAMIRTTAWTWLPVLFGVGLAVGLTLVVTALLLDVRRLARKRAMETQRADLQKKASRLEDRLKKTYAAPIAMIAQTGAGDAETLKAKRRAARDWVEEQDRFAREEADLLGGKTRADLEADWQAAKAATEELTREAGEDVDIESLRDAIRHLTQELDSAPSAASAPAVTAPHNGSSPVPLRDYATDISACLSKLTDARFSSVSDDQGRLRLVRRDAPDQAALDAVSSGEALQARLAVALGAWIARRNGLGFPLILDDPLAGLDPRSRKALLDTMAAAAGDRQIILLTNSAVPDIAGVSQTALTVG